MAVYVDDYFGAYRGMLMSHMIADSVEELHAFAARLGLRREWFQDKATPHYDVSMSKRAEALRLGAVDLPIRQRDGSANPEWRATFRRVREQKLAQQRG